MGWNRIIVALPVEPLGKPAAAAASLWNGHLREEEEEAEDGPRRPQSFRWEGKQRSSWVLSDLLANRTLSVAACFRFFCERIIRETEYGRDWNSGGPLSDRTSKPPPPPSDCIPFEQQLCHLDPCCGCLHDAHFYFEFPVAQTCNVNPSGVPHCERKPPWQCVVFVFCFYDCGLRPLIWQKTRKRE